MMRKTLILTIITTFLSINCIGQKFIDEVNATLDKYESKLDNYEKAINEERKRNAQLRIKLNELLRQKNVDDLKLQKAFQDLNFSNLKLEKKEAQLDQLKKEYDIEKDKNEALTIEKKKLELRINQLKENFSTLEIERENYIKRLLEQIKNNRIRFDLYKIAKEKSRNDFESGKKKSTLGRFRKTRTLLSLNSGARVFTPIDTLSIDGPSYSVEFGWLVSRKNNIYLGIGGDYQFYRNQNEGLFSAFIASKFSLINSDLIATDGVSLYSCLDLGYTFHEDTSTIKGGIFTNIGLGIYFTLSDNIKLDLNASWRRLNGGLRVIDDYEDNIFNSLDGTLGLIIVL